ncbi:MAG: DUF3086 domain-containing protein [Chamaesiphon sp. CSU_1_12]|nr:DUF3086 domain-containing protein [Chamaesiphon sp. CSU_1_12]
MNNSDDLQPDSVESEPQADPQTEPGLSVDGAIAAEQNAGLDGAGSPTEQDAAGEAVTTKAGESETGGEETSGEAALRVQKQSIQAELAALKQERDRLSQDLASQRQALQTLLDEGLASFKQRQGELQRSIDQLERRRDSIRKEMQDNFAGTSQELALRVQGFKDYLVGSLQDLAAAADKLELVRDNRTFQPSPQDFPQSPSAAETAANGEKQAVPLPGFAQKTDLEQEAQIRESLERYRTSPDYYGPPWQLRRTFEPVHEALVSKWFFDQGGRGALKSLGSRLQNILVASAAISVLNEFYGDRCCILVLANSPERLGDWRRGFQDCLGLSKPDFGGNGGIILFEDPEALIQKVDRIVASKEMPFIIIDNSEGQISLSILQYPLWLAFAPDPERQLDDFREYR